MLHQYESSLDTWVANERKALELIGLIGKLWYDHEVELNLFHRPLFDCRVTEILQYIKESEDYTYAEIDIELLINMTKTILAQSPKSIKIDLGRLADEQHTNMWTNDQLQSLIKDTVAELSKSHLDYEPKDVVLFGFGRIGRIMCRLLVNHVGTGTQLRLRAIVCRNNSSAADLHKRASLLRKDSVHGRFRGSIEVDEANKSLIVNGNHIYMIEGGNPEDVDYSSFGINNAILIDNTGVWRDRPNLERHLKAKGIGKVILTAPGKGDLPNIVYGINHTKFNISDENILTAASCTTNAVVPTLKIIEENFGIEKGHIETVHAYTNDQNLLDNYHKKERRGRSAPLNLVITETGAGKAASKAIPSLEGKLTSNAVRVPTPNVSMAIMNLNLHKATNAEQLDELLNRITSTGGFYDLVEYALSPELVSSDLVGNPHPGIIDGKATIVAADGKSIVLYVWYDNEFGYSMQVLRLTQFLAGVEKPCYH